MEITEELIGQTYQFCYKRLANPDDARDLAQDILCEALQAIASGRNITYFPGWFWKMARNRYAVMLNRRNHQATEYLIEDDWELLISEENEAIDDLILEEELSRMHAVIARMAAIHRDILVEYFIREQPVKEIAKKLNIPEGTVKRRLFDAKREVKEEMRKMPRITELSYAPHELELWASGGLDGVEVFRDLLGRQILASCYQKGCSIPELSESIQVAAVYLEDKISALERIGLLKRTGKNKYLTNFLIFPKNAINLMLCDLETMYAAMCEAAYRVLLEEWDVLQEFCIYGMDLPMEYQYTVFLPLAMQWIGSCCVREYHKYMPQEQQKSEEIDAFDYRSRRIMGQVLAAGEELTNSQVETTPWRRISRRIDTAEGKSYMVCDEFCTDVFPAEKSQVIHGRNIELLCELSRNPDKTLSASEEVNAGVLVKHGMITKKEDGYYPNILIFEQQKFWEMERHMIDALRPKSKELQEELVKTIHKHLIPYVREDLLEQYYHYVIKVFMIPVAHMVGWGQEKQLLPVSENADINAAGIYVIERF